METLLVKLRPSEVKYNRQDSLGFRVGVGAGFDRSARAGKSIALTTLTLAFCLLLSVVKPLD